MRLYGSSPFDESNPESSHGPPQGQGAVGRASATGEGKAPSAKAKPQAYPACKARGYTRTAVVRSAGLHTYSW